MATNKQTNKKRFPGEKVGKREARPGERGRGEAREYRGWGGGLNGYAFPVIIQFWDVESRFAFAILLFNVLKESFV